MTIIIIEEPSIRVTKRELDYYEQQLNKEIDDGCYVGGNPPTLEEYIRMQKVLWNT